MALSRVKTWIAGEVLTASDLNAEFNNILNNPVSLLSPLNGSSITLDTSAATSFQSTASVGWNFTTGAKSGTPGTTGSIANWSAQTFTDSNTAGSGTAAAWVGYAIQRPTLAATNSSVTTTAAATLYIPNSPAAGTNQTITNAYAIWVDGGISRFDGDLVINGLEVGLGGGSVSTNTAFGDTALDSNTTGSNNTAIGYAALTANTTGGFNLTAVGASALAANTTGQYNTAIGTQSLLVSTTASSNTAVGSASLFDNTTGSYNTAIGQDSLANNTTGYSNTSVGQNCGSTITTGHNNTVLGYDAQASSATANNEITLGDGNIATLRCQVTSITALSDERDKKDIQDIPLGIEFIQHIRPVKFTWNRRDGSKVGVQEIGFIAQELDAVQRFYHADDYLKLVLHENPDRLEASPGKLLPIMVKAIQELKTEFDDYKRTHP